MPQREVPLSHKPGPMPHTEGCMPHPPRPRQERVKASLSVGRAFKALSPKGTLGHAASEQIWRRLAD